MGQGGSGYEKLPTQSRGQMGVQSTVEQMAQGQNGIQNNPLYQNAVAGINQFLPGGGGGAPIAAEAQRRYQQTTLPSIMNAFGSNAKSSSALNQALGASAADLNSSIASELARMQLSAAQAGGQLAQQPYTNQLNASQVALGTQPFAYQQKGPETWERLLTAIINAGGQAAGGAIRGGI